jgi:Flp pilus assembly pilin Flp
MTRTTQAEVKGMFNRLCKAMNKRVATKYNDVGAWAIEYTAVYGGWLAYEITNESGCTSNILISKRLPSKDMYQALYMAVCAVEYLNYNKERA